MKKSLATIPILLLSATLLTAQEHDHPAPAPSPNWAKQALERSPRHGEWVNVKSGNRVVSAFVVYPEISTAFRFATNRPTLAAAFVFYGSGPESPEAIAAIKAPVYGFYAGNDARIGATVPKTQELMKAAGKTYDVVTYEGAGHGFMRAGEAPPPPADADAKTKEAYAANQKARDEAWTRWKAVLRKL
jgi:pimeloyl-ACP methyl ester carboxylesterase